MSERSPQPRWTGIETYKDRLGRYTFRYPLGWHTFELDNGLDGVMLAPAANDPQTYVSAWAAKLNTGVKLEDQPLLQEGVAEGLAQLAEFASLAEEDSAYGNMLKFERIYTFHDGQATRKRKSWLLYVDYWQISLTYQGESPEEYEYWLPMGNYAFSHFTMPPDLWFATDRDLNKPSPIERGERVKRGRQGQA